MKERPILFSAPMVRAILSGQKTQTRRAMRNQVVAPGIVRMAGPGYCEIVNEHGVNIPGFTSPYGKPSDRLWVRETWAQPTTLDPGPTIYRADYPACVPAYYINVPPADEVVWRPSIHMPRTACRIVLEIMGVRVERLNDISETDCIAEGIQQLGEKQGWACEARLPDGKRHFGAGAYDLFRQLWESINGPGSWAANPWMWVVEFRRIQ